MLLIIIGIVVLAIGELIVWHKNYDALGGIGFAICLILCLIGLFAPLHGYNELDVQKHELISLNDEIYVIKEERGGFICNHVGQKQKAEMHFRYHTGDEEVIFINEGEKPVLVKYEQKAKKSIWTMALWSSIKSNVFYVPESGYRDMGKEDVN